MEKGKGWECGPRVLKCHDCRRVEGVIRRQRDRPPEELISLTEDNSGSKGLFNKLHMTSLKICLHIHLILLLINTVYVNLQLLCLPCLKHFTCARLSMEFMRRILECLVMEQFIIMNSNYKHINKYSAEYSTIYLVITNKITCETKPISSGFI